MNRLGQRQRLNALYLLYTGRRLGSRCVLPIFWSQCKLTLSELLDAVSQSQFTFLLIIFSAHDLMILQTRRHGRSILSQIKAENKLEM